MFSEFFRIRVQSFYFFLINYPTHTGTGVLVQNVYLVKCISTSTDCVRSQQSLKVLMNCCLQLRPYVRIASVAFRSKAKFFFVVVCDASLIVALNDAVILCLVLVLFCRSSCLSSFVCILYSFCYGREGWFTLIVVLHSCSC